MILGWNRIGMANQTRFAQQLADTQQHLHAVLLQQLAELNTADERLAAAMQHGLMNGGKRLRPYLVYATAEALGSRQENADVAAAAIEMIHSYSLVHDDLPAMDDDDLRRGQPTCHIAFDEATAILAGDALLTGAFQCLTQAPELTPQQRLNLIQILAQASGAAGMVAGQAIDLANVNKAMDQSQLQQMHQLKTGALIKAAVLMGATVADEQLADTVRQQLERYADCIGLAFQVQDDILDIESDTATLGKQQGADKALNKPTYPALLGLSQAKQLALDLVAEAHSALHNIAQYDTFFANESRLERLAGVADYIIERRF